MENEKSGVQIYQNKKITKKSGLFIHFQRWLYKCVYEWANIFPGFLWWILKDAYFLQ